MIVRWLQDHHEEGGESVEHEKKLREVKTPLFVLDVIEEQVWKWLRLRNSIVEKGEADRGGEEAGGEEEGGEQSLERLA